MRKWSMLLLSALLFARPAGAQVFAVISGTVTDTAGHPIEGVTVSLERSRDSWVRRNITDAKGRYVLVGVPTDSAFDLVARRLGYGNVVRPNTRGRADHALVIDFTMAGKPVELDPLTVRAHKRIFKRQLATVTAEEIRGKSYIVTAADVFRILRPYAFRVRREECAAHRWKVFVDSVRMDFPFGNILTRVKAREIESIEIHPCTDRWLPIRYWNSIWITTHRAHWLARRGPAGISGAN